MTRLELANHIFGSLVALYPTAPDKHRKWKWLCRCACGKELEVTASHLVAGHTTSCGCRMGYITHGGSYTRLYHIWDGMKQRCNNPKNKAYVWYGMKGVKLDSSWEDFIVFRDWALNAGYADNLTIDRIDSNKNYSPDNCEWVTGSENSKRRIKNGKEN